MDANEGPRESKPGRIHCEELLRALSVVEENFFSLIQGVSQKHLNHTWAPHKMTLGQIAVHAGSWPVVFMSDKPPWELTHLTCRPCDYPLTPEFVDRAVKEGLDALRRKLRESDDALLEAGPDGKKGKGYIIYRVLIHFMTHGMQVGYLRHLLDPSWKPGSQFGDMATAFIRMTYHTERDLTVRGF